MSKSADKRKPRAVYAFFVLLVVAVVAVAIIFGARRDAVERKNRVMFDTLVRVTITAPKNFDFDSAFGRIWARLVRLEAAFDPYDSAGILHALNESDTSFAVTRELGEAVSSGLAFGDTFSGAFDIRVGELTSLWDFAGEGHVPSDEELAAVLSRMNTAISVSDSTVVKSGLYPKVDLGAIAKGYAADRVAEILDSIPGIRRYIIDLGGNIRVWDIDGKPFKIGIRHPRKASDIVGAFMLESGLSCATAGDYERFFERDGVKYHHILDPVTGRPSRKCSGVTVIAPTATMADIYSTAFFVMGPERAADFAEEHPDVEYVIFDTLGETIDGNIHFSD